MRVFVLHIDQPKTHMDESRVKEDREKNIVKKKDTHRQSIPTIRKNRSIRITYENEKRDVKRKKKLSLPYPECVK